jgi:hypothetical protein
MRSAFKSSSAQADKVHVQKQKLRRLGSEAFKQACSEMQKIMFAKLFGAQRPISFSGTKELCEVAKTKFWQKYTPPRRPPWQKKKELSLVIRWKRSRRKLPPGQSAGLLPDDKLDLKDLKAVVKFTHIMLGKTGFSKFNTKALCLQFLATVSPAWDTLLPDVYKSGAPAPPPSPPAAAPAPTGPAVLLKPPPATTCA